MPNNDTGCDIIRESMLSKRAGDTQIYLNLARRDYLGLLKNCSCIVGNSSSGLLEAPTFEVPAVNLGRRQGMRFRGANVIDAPFHVDRIVETIETALSSDFRRKLDGTENPYGDGRSSERILDILKNTPRDDRLLIKQLTY